MTDSQYLASIEISEDQNTITGVTLVSVDYDGEGDKCQWCALLGANECIVVGCTADQRSDGRDVIFVVNSDD